MKYRVLRLGDYYYAQCRYWWWPFWFTILRSGKYAYWVSKSGLRTYSAYKNDTSEEAGDVIRRFIDYRAKESVEYTVEVEVI